MACAVILGGGGLVIALLTLIAGPLGLGGADFGYKKMLALLIGLEAAATGLLLWWRVRAIA